MNLWSSTIIGLIVAERAVELLHSRRNTNALRRRGAVEVDQRRYPLIVAVHLAWLVAIVAALPAHTEIRWFWVVVLTLLQPVRLWTILSLGPYWTTRVLMPPDAELVRSGPYRFLRHPAYLIAGVEIAVAPLIFGEIWIAAGFFALNALVMAGRIRAEDAALDSLVAPAAPADAPAVFNPAAPPR